MGMTFNEGIHKEDTSSIMPDWHIKEIDGERWNVYTKNYVYLGTFTTKSDAYNYITSNFLHKRGVIHVHKINGAVIEELKFPVRKLPIRFCSEHESDYNLEQEPTTKNDPIDYRRAFKIACDLLNGCVLYGIDADRIFEIMMAKDGVVSSDSYESYILNHLQELDKGQYASERTTKNDCADQNGCISCSLDDGDDCCRKLYEESMQEPATKNDLVADIEDAVERLNALKQLIGYDKDSEIVKATQKSHDMAIKALEHEPKIRYCKDCKWWKDSDGKYRRGCEAESQCPINCREVFEGM